MNPRPLLLDGCCGAGGASAGYWRAGFSVHGVDIERQPNYPHIGYLGDVLKFIRQTRGRYDAYHISPPCQRYSHMTKCRPGLLNDYPDMIGTLRELLNSIGKPYVIENVVGSPLVDPIKLCGQMFGLDLYRHRLFEANFPLVAPDHPVHVKPASRAGHWKPGTVISIAGHVAPIAVARAAMGIDWMTRDELAEAIPPAYTSFIGEQLLAQIKAVA